MTAGIEPSRSDGQRWSLLPGHRAWLHNRVEDLVRFALTTMRADGGFHYPTAAGTPQPGRPTEAYLTARMVHMASIAHLQGIPGAGRLLSHGMESLDGAFWDRRHGGFLNALEQPDARKLAYDQVHCGLAAASAMAAGHPEAARLLDHVVDVVETHLWDSDHGMLRESFEGDWTGSEDYRGANANMHGVEAFLAIGDITGDAVWHHRALGMADRIVNDHARAHDWLVPEHFDAKWRVDLDHNADEPNHPFRPFGATLGHSFEWARFLVQLDASPAIDHTAWLQEAAEDLTTSALSAWACDGTDGLPYTVDWARRPVSSLRLHWPVCEAIQACAVLARTTTELRWESWYRALWDHASHFIDDRGTWIPELDSDLQPSDTIWPGRPDVYHCVGASTAPTVDATPFMTLAVADRPSRLARP